PNLSNRDTITSRALPFASRSMNGTFSRRTQGTGRVSSKRHTSPTSPEFAPSIPAVLPAWLRSWQGKPPTKRSTLDGIFSTFRTSSSRGSEGKQFRALPARAGRSRRASWFRDRRGRGRVRDHQIGRAHV